MADTGAEQRRLRVFISYSRKDAAFAQDLLAGLEVGGFEPYLDKHDIAAGEDWELRLRRLIESADAVVFVISPDSVASPRCAWEVERTHELRKRLLPIVWRAVEEVKVPPRLKQLNYIYFDQPNSFGAPLQVLAGALRTDLEWIREHTRIGESALRWDGRGRADALLPRGEELAAIKLWLGAQPKYGPEPTLLMHEFIKAGEDAEFARTTIERQRLDQMAAALQREKAAQDDREIALKNEKAALRNAQRANIAAGLLLACLLAGIVAWSNRKSIQEAYHWRMKSRPTVLTAEQERDKMSQPGSSFKECMYGCPTMVVVPAGRFKMGSPDAETDRAGNESPQHDVHIANAFAVSKFEVTFEEWDSCVDAAGCTKRASSSQFVRDPRLPVINVTWDDAKQYVAWLSRMTGKDYRLLTEAEWEYAARAGANTPYAWGNEISADNANCRACGSRWDNRQPAPVGSFTANAFGLHDMHGNVFEWVEDLWHDGYAGAPSDGTAWLSDVKDSHLRARVRRGGAFDTGSGAVRAAYRSRGTQDNGDRDIGFRLARTLQ